MSEKAVLKKLYKKIPSFDCIEGCSDCCGPVPVSSVEAKKLGIDTGITSVKMGTCECVYSSSEGCTVYENRPFMCRLFGATKNLVCPHGKEPNKPLTAEQGRRLADEYRKLGTIPVKQVDSVVGYGLKINKS
jgi:Fe-S-cluster containining protein